MDYDQTSIPAVYDRGRDHGPQVVQRWMNSVKQATDGHGRIRSILDLGCGTGRFSPGLAHAFGADVIGIDPSFGMLARAAAKPHGPSVRYAMGWGEDVPLRDGTVDLVFISMVFHHFRSPARVAGECRRVLRKEGIVFLRGGTTDRIPAYPYAPFFPSSVPLMHETLQSCTEIRDCFGAANFRTLAQGVVEQEIAATHADYRVKLATGADSVLARLSRVDFEAGLADLEEFSAAIDPRPVIEPIDYFVFA
jgi:ubiquinone/menaquinone biosynthesis C-methylase UbiE